MKIGIIVEMLRLPLEDGIIKAKELGAEGIQIYAVSRYLNMLQDPALRLKELKNIADANGLCFSAVCSDLGGHGFADPAGNPERLEKTKRIMEASHIFESKVLTTHIGVVPKAEDVSRYADMVETLRKAGDLALAEGMTLAIETGPKSAADLRKLILDVDNAGIRVNFDPANLAMVQNEDAAEAVSKLGEFIVHTHAKDGLHLRDCDPARVYNAFAEGGFSKLVEETGELFREVPLGEGQVKWDPYLKALKASGYDGFLTIEREVGANPEKDIAMAVTFLKEKLSSLSI